jgi:DNA-directed RNA polymerase specialized sigma24 family protein
MVTGVLSGLAICTNVAVSHYREQRKQRERYAEHVAAWSGPHVPSESHPDHHQGYRFRTVVVNNGSDQPVYDVVVSVPVPDADLLPGEEPLAYRAIGLVPPGEKTEVDLGEIGQFSPQFAAPLAVSFTDVQRIKWYRDDQGRLHRGDRALPAGA